MQSNNPILNRVETHADYSQPMTVQGAIQKSVLLTVIAAVVGMALFLYCFMTLNISLAYAATLVGAIGGLILGLIATFKPNTARTLAIPYALFEGVKFRCRRDSCECDFSRPNPYFGGIRY
jgi:uncharacterized YccA/Bax inhibitor family protein